LAQGRKPEWNMTPEQTKAFKAFKKRLKLTQLDDESGLSRGSKTSRIVGITPPSGFPSQVWEELVSLGKLRREPYGMYALAARPPQS
jgi:hypothetical protein